jgi:hypothetical protein
MINYIYILIDPRDNKIKYIGKSNNVEDRYVRHLRQCNSETPTKKNNWIKSLKEKGLKPLYEVIDECDSDYINDLEVYWIEQFRQWGIELKNMTEGGDGYDWTGRKHRKESKIKCKMNHPFRKEVCKYNENGELLEVYNSIREASRLTGINRRHITGCCKKSKSYFLAGGFVWRYKGEEFDYKPYEPHSKKSIIQYTLDMVEVDRYDSIRSASRETGIYKSGICACCKGIQKTAGGYMWLYDLDH